MSKEAKYTMYFVGFICVLIMIAGVFSGCEHKGIQGWIYHDKNLIAKTVCEDELFLTINPDTIVVKSSYNSYGAYWDKEVYKYVNDGNYRVERKECVR